MPLYPTFEHAKVEGLLESQHEAIVGMQRTDPEAYVTIARYMGLDLSNYHYNDAGELVPGPVSPPPSTAHYPAAPPPSSSSTPQPQQQQQVAICAPHGSRALIQAKGGPGEIRHGVRRVLLCKDPSGKVGVQLVSVDNGIFVSFVKAGSPAALGGIRFGDQVLSICDQVVAGFSGDKAMNLIRKGPANNLEIMVRDRPFERTIVVNKSSSGEIGISIDSGLIKAIHKDSSAARNGVLVGHQIVEVNGQNVLGLKDKQLKELLHRTPDSIRLTIIPQPIYKHMVKHLWKDKIRSEMDRSLPEA
ncbi:unnamed protein product [Dicrocoelium dendriticum]|nr:unnamed protein product [Dicrocoelium dendriticum]